VGIGRLAGAVFLLDSWLRDWHRVFNAFRGLGRPLDHVNAHRHYHLHPLVAHDLFVIGERFGMRSMRVPVEPTGVLARAEPGQRPAGDVADLWARLLKARATRAGVRTADAVFGLRWSGHMNAVRFRGLLENAPRGLVEIYTHPATGDDFPGHAPGYRYTDELSALVEPTVVAAVRTSGRRPAGYADAA
jgi:predicted glycoside hydrolase/deacetylase ChbG (UPF0249 family)